ncbi:hypothetical protein DITRI_Ditri14bG0127400 [Diplodiscus trichospermus]
MRYSLCSFLGFSEVLNKKSPQIRSPDLPEDICCRFSLAKIKAATNNFHPDSIIGGDRHYWSVYKGTMDDGTVVAVKRYQSIESHTVRELKNEVRLLCQLRHPHLISLIGFCYEQNEIILVYENMSGGSLSDNLYGAKRIVFHRHIKSLNILLDDEGASKLTDFGLSRICPLRMSKSLIEMESEMEGTLGYLDPDLFNLNTLVTDKSDAYSFGVVLFEVLCGREVIKSDVEQNQKFLIPWVCDCMRNGTIYQTIDPYLKGKIAHSCLQKFLEVAFSCIRFQGSKRPALGEVEATLELALELQNRADSEMERINPHGEGTYEEVLFSVPSIFLITFQIYTGHMKFLRKLASKPWMQFQLLKIYHLKVSMHRTSHFSRI